MSTPSPEILAAVRPLSTTEVVTKNELIEVIDRTMQSFIECGTALARVRDEQLYRDEHDTFEAFVDARWNLSARRARQLMAAAEIAGSLPTGTAVPLTERHVRELMPLRDRPELMAEVLEVAALDERGVTGDTVKAAVDLVVRRTEFTASVIDEWADVLPDFDANVLTRIITVQWAAKHRYLTGHDWPLPAWLDLTDMADGAGCTTHASWSLLVFNEAQGFLDWVAAVGLGDPYKIVTADDALTDIEWNDEALGRWLKDETFTVEDRRLAAIGHAFCWSSSAVNGVGILDSMLARSAVAR